MKYNHAMRLWERYSSELLQYIRKDFTSKEVKEMISIIIHYHGSEALNHEVDYIHEKLLAEWEVKV